MYTVIFMDRVKMVTAHTATYWSEFPWSPAMVSEGSAGNSRSGGGKLLGKRGQLPEGDKEKIFTMSSSRGRQNTTAVVEKRVHNISASGHRLHRTFSFAANLTLYS